MRQTRAGLIFGASAYLIWGSFPAYFSLIMVVSPLEVVPWRVMMTLLFCAILLTFSRRWGQLTQVLKRPKQLGWFTLSALMLYANWQLFVIGVMTGHVLETALGYFINPLFTILLGVILRKERLTRLQWIAVSIAAVGVTASAIAYGTVPWIALGLAFSFGMYGALRKYAGDDTDGVTSLAIETLTTVPLAIIQLIVVAAVLGLSAFSFGTGISALVLLSGVVTAVPLILFGEAGRRLPLSYLGFLQFLTPVLSFVYGFFVMHEEVSTGRWIGFIAVWIALVLLIIDMVRQVRSAPGGAGNFKSLPLE